MRTETQEMATGAAAIDETLLTPEEVAQRLKVKPFTVREWLRRGKLRGIRLAGKTWRIRPSDVDAFLRTWESSGPEAAGEHEAKPGTDV